MFFSAVDRSPSAFSMFAERDGVLLSAIDNPPAQFIRKPCAGVTSPELRTVGEDDVCLVSTTGEPLR
jgi:hypothetical protein